jgi:hypothetical protein
VPVITFTGAISWAAVPPIASSALKGLAIMRLSHFSVAAKLYVLFALMAATTLALSIVAFMTSRQHAVLASAYNAANLGTAN